MPKAQRIPHYIETEQSWFLLVQAECTYQKSERDHHTEACWIESRAQEQQLLSSSRSWSCSTSLQNQKFSIHFSFWKFAARLGRENRRINTLSQKKTEKNHTKTISKERGLLRPRERIAQESVRGSPWTGCGECGIGARDYCDEAVKKTQPSGGIKVAISEWQPPRSCHLARINDHKYGYLWDVALLDWCTPMHFKTLFSATCRRSRPAVRCPGAMSLKKSRDSSPGGAGFSDRAR